MSSLDVFERMYIGEILIKHGIITKNYEYIELINGLYKQEDIEKYIKLCKELVTDQRKRNKKGKK